MAVPRATNEEAITNLLSIFISKIGGEWEHFLENWIKKKKAKKKARR
jgi:hypothetical protein